MGVGVERGESLFEGRETGREREQGLGLLVQGGEQGAQGEQGEEGLVLGEQTGGVGLEHAQAVQEGFWGEDGGIGEGGRRVERGV